MRLHGARDASRPERLAGQGGELPRIRGLLLVYLIALIPFALHGSVLTIGSIVVYAHSSATGSHSHVPLSSLVFYVITNVTLILYVIYLLILMSRRRKSAIINNIVFNILSVAFLVSWYVIGEKSNTGTIVDSVPNLVGAAYFLLSRRVRNTFVIGLRPSPH
jgi:cell division protein FtsW (lipid II flippase)